MPSSSHHHHHRRTGKPGRRTRVNVKIVLALLLLVVLAGVAGGAFLLIRKHRHNPEPYALKGDELVAQGDYKTAIKQYEKAFYYDQNNPAILLKLAHAVESSTPDSPEQAARNLARVIGILENERSTWQSWHVRAEALRQTRAAGVPAEMLDRVVEDSGHSPDSRSPEGGSP